MDRFNPKPGVATWDDLPEDAEEGDVRPVEDLYPLGIIAGYQHGEWAEIQFAWTQSARILYLITDLWGDCPAEEILLEIVRELADTPGSYERIMGRLPGSYERMMRREPNVD